MEKFEVSIDHPMLKNAKAGFDACMRAMVSKAITTNSMEGTATLKISFEINEGIDEKTGELIRMPEIKYKAGYSVPMKQGCDGIISERSRIIWEDEGGWMLVNEQVNMFENMEEA